jgi:hypothetical protein
LGVIEVDELDRVCWACGSKEGHSILSCSTLKEVLIINDGT